MGQEKILNSPQKRVQIVHVGRIGPGNSAALNVVLNEREEGAQQRTFTWLLLGHQQLCTQQH